MRAPSSSRDVPSVFPCIRTVLVVCGLFRLIDSFKAFALIYVLINGGPGSVTEVTNYWPVTIESGVIRRVGSKYFHFRDLGCSLYLRMQRMRFLLRSGTKVNTPRAPGRRRQHRVFAIERLDGGLIVGAVLAAFRTRRRSFRALDRVAEVYSGAIFA